MSKLIKLSLALVPLVLCIACPVKAQDMLWTSPSYPASAPKKIEIKIETHFNYHQFTPVKQPQKLRLLQQKYASLATPEEALVSRFSAISSLDYPWWLNTWQQSSKQKALAFFQQKGLDKNYWLNAWEKQFVGRDIRLKHKIIYQDYVVFIYNVAEPSGKDGYFDLPVVFHQEANQWLVSLDLSQNELLNLSPWVTGQSSETIVYE